MVERSAAVSERLPKEVTCKRTAARLNELLPFAFSYGEERGRFDRAFRAYDALTTEWLHYPEGWEGNIRGMLACAELFGSAERTEQFLRENGSELPRQHRELLQRWKVRPWVFAALEVVELYGDGLLEAVPLGKPPAVWSESGEWESLLLYSHAVSEQVAQGCTLFLTQLWDGGEAFHTYGAVISLDSIDPHDLFCFADICQNAHRPAAEMPLPGVAGRAEALSDIMAAEPLSFLRLFRLTGMPREPALCCSPAVLAAGREIVGYEDELAALQDAFGGLELEDDQAEERRPQGEGLQAEPSGLSQDAFAKLTSRGAPRVSGVFSLRNAEQITQALQAAGIEPETSLFEAPALRFAGWFLGKALEAGEIRATPAGYVATALVSEAVEQRIIPTPADQHAADHPEETLSPEAARMLVPKKERDWPDFERYRRLLERCGLIHYDGRRFHPGGNSRGRSRSDEEAAALAGAPVELYRILLSESLAGGSWVTPSRLPVFPPLADAGGFLLYSAGQLQEQRAGTDGWVELSELTTRFLSAIQAPKGPPSTLPQNAFANARWYLDIKLDVLFVRRLGGDFHLLEHRRGSEETGAYFRTTALFDAVFERGE